MRERERVFLWNVQSYDPAIIADRVGKAMDKLLIKPKGRVLVKPNCVLAHPQLSPHAFTRPEVLDGVLQALQARATEDTAGIVVGERCGITVPTRFPFRSAGYLPVCKRHGVEPRYFEEERPVEVLLEHKGRLRDSIYLPEPVADTDFFVNVPKLKTHPWTTVTAALKNKIGVQDDGHRLIDHDHRLDEKIRDLNAAVRCKLIVIDAITAGLGRMLTPKPVELGLLIMGANPVATDAIACRLLGLQPAEVDHVRMAHELGLGPVALPDITMRGDIELEEACARAKAKGFTPDRVRVEEFFEGTGIRALAGTTPEPGRADYCWGGCPGASQEALDIMRVLQPDVGEKIRPLLLLYGDLAGKSLDPREGERILVFGDCARLAGRVGSQALVCESTYVDRGKRDVHNVRTEGLVTKMVKLLIRLWRSRRETHIRVPGCPASVAEHVLLFSLLGKVRNPYLDRRIVLPYVAGWIATVAVQLWRRLTGKLKPRRALPTPGDEDGPPTVVSQS